MKLIFNLQEIHMLHFPHGPAEGAKFLRSEEGGRRMDGGKVGKRRRRDEEGEAR